MEKKLFRYKKIFVPQFLSGVFLSYSALDNILEGLLRELSKQYFDLGEFGSNAREESLYFIILFFWDISNSYFPAKFFSACY